MFQFCLRAKSNSPLRDVAVVKQQEHRGSADIESICDTRMVVDVECSNLDSSVLLRREFLQHWLHFQTRLAPGSPEFHENRLHRLQDFMLKIGLR